MNNVDVINLFNAQRYTYPISEIIIFFNYPAILIKLIKTSKFVTSYMYNAQNIIIYKYDTSLFPCSEFFYLYLISIMHPEQLYSFSYSYLGGITNTEKYMVIHKNIYAEFFIYRDYMTHSLELDVIMFRIHGLPALLYNLHQFNLKSKLEIFSFITTYIDENILM